MAVSHLDRRMLAILAADVVGYSTLMEVDEAGTIARLRALRAEIADPLIAGHHGKLVKLMGDGALIAFASVVDAVACAVAIQRAVATRNAGLPEPERLVFRMGVNLGDVALVDGDVYGDGVNVAARLEQRCEPGGVMVSGTAYDHLQGKLDVALEFAGEQKVKGIARPVRAYRVQVDGTKARPRLGLPRRRLIPAMAALVALLAVGGVWWFWPAATVGGGKPAIAVLPFEDYGGDAATARLADGMTEDITTDLARFRDLDVIARNSTEAYKGKPVDVREVGQALNVGYVLEGSIQRQADRVRITGQLIDTGTGAHVWSERWDRPANDLFAVQSEIAERVADTLASYGVIAQARRAEAKRKPPASLDAYETYLLGVEAKGRQTKESIDEAIRLLTRAVAMDPGLARAWIALAWAHAQSEGFGADPAQARKGQEEAGRRAIELDPADSEAHTLMAEIAGIKGDFRQAEAEFDKALSLNPSSFLVQVNYASWASSFGQPDKGAQVADRAIHLNPNYPLWSIGGFRTAYFLAGRYEDTLRVVARKPAENRNKSDLVLGAGAAAALGRLDEAKATVAEALRRFPDLTIEGFAVSDPSWAAWERERLVDTMRQAGFPLCASEEVVKATPGMKRLPECVSS